MTADVARQASLTTVLSGPAGGVAGASFLAQELAWPLVITLDMGGTSTDISLMYRGQLRMQPTWSVEYGHPIMFPSVEVITIGAGGGSIAWLDPGGSLRNGPQSAGAEGQCRRSAAGADQRLLVR